MAKRQKVRDADVGWLEVLNCQVPLRSSLSPYVEVQSVDSSRSQCGLTSSSVRRNVVETFCCRRLLKEKRYNLNISTDTAGWSNQGPIPVAARSKPWDLAAWLLGTQVRIPLGPWMFVLCLFVVLSCVGRGHCVRVITRPEESYRVSKIDNETSRVRRPRSLQRL
jgi:hypothetical protein